MNVPAGATAVSSPSLAVDVPLFVDLDGTLVRTDTLYEALMSTLKRRPWLVVMLPFWLLRGKAFLKHKLAELGPVNAGLLPYDEDVLARARAEHARGRQVVLATAADRSIALGVADYLGFFDGVIASDGDHNLKGGAKLQAIKEWAQGPFDYIGDSRSDLPIWNASRRPLAVRGGFAAARALRANGREVEMLGVGPRSWASAIRCLRPHQWAKNVLIFLPLLASHIYRDVGLWVNDVLALVAFSLCASCVYVVNDLLDLESDRCHPRKRRRPFASGELSIPFGIFVSIVLLGVSAALAWLSGPAFTMVLATYFALTLSYSLKLKAVVLVDTVVLAGLYTMRVIAGYAATGIVPTFWLLAFALFLFFGLAMLKRFSELMELRKRKGETTPGRGYRADDIDIVGIFGASTGCMAILILAFYINTSDVTRLYAHPQVLWGIVPVLLYWISKIWLIAHRGEMHEDPVVYALTDRESLAVFGISACIALAATF